MAAKKQKEKKILVSVRLDKQVVDLAREHKAKTYIPVKAIIEKAVREMIRDYNEREKGFAY